MSSCLAVVNCFSRKVCSGLIETGKLQPANASVQHMESFFFFFFFKLIFFLYMTFNSPSERARMEGTSTGCQVLALFAVTINASVAIIVSMASSVMMAPQRCSLHIRERRDHESQENCSTYSFHTKNKSPLFA